MTDLILADVTRVKKLVIFLFKVSVEIFLMRKLEFNLKFHQLSFYFHTLNTSSSVDFEMLCSFSFLQLKIIASNAILMNEKSHKSVFRFMLLCLICKLWKSFFFFFAKENCDGGIAFTAFDYTLKVFNLRHYWNPNPHTITSSTSFLDVFMFRNCTKAKLDTGKWEIFAVLLETWKLSTRELVSYPLKILMLASHYRHNLRN